MILKRRDFDGQPEKGEEKNQSGEQHEDEGNFLYAQGKGEPFEGGVPERQDEKDGGRAEPSHGVLDANMLAAHGAKVLLKFKLLELQKLPLAELVAWAQRTAYFSIVHSRWFSGVPMEQWMAQLVESLVRSGVARREGEYVLNE